MAVTPYDTNFPGTPRVQPVHVEDQPVVVGMHTLQGPVAAFGSNPASTTASTDYQFKWGAAGNQQVNHVILQNNTTAVVNYDIDNTASAGTLTLAAGATIFLDVSMLVLHLFTAGVQAVNGAAAAGIVVRAWL